MDFVLSLRIAKRKIVTADLVSANASSRGPNRVGLTGNAQARVNGSIMFNMLISSYV